jgi:hypothetical protein
VPEDEDAEVFLGPVEGRGSGRIGLRRGHRRRSPTCSGFVPLRLGGGACTAPP